MESPLHARLHAKVDRSGGPDACWPFNRNRSYGHILKNDGKLVATHRLAWEIANGRAPRPGMEICHTCDNPPCCNPAHLFEGTRRDNMRDKVLKGRVRRGWHKSPITLNHADRRDAWADICETDAHDFNGLGAF